MAELTPGQKRTHDLAKKIAEEGGIIINYVNAQPNYSTHQIGISTPKDRNAALKIASENGFENVVLGKGNNISIKNPEYNPQIAKNSKKSGSKKAAKNKKRLSLIDHAVNLRKILNSSGFSVGSLNKQAKSLSFKCSNDESKTFMKSAIELAGKEGYGVRQSGKKALRVLRGPKLSGVADAKPAVAPKHKQKTVPVSKDKSVPTDLKSFAEDITFKYMSTLDVEGQRAFAQAVASRAGLVTIDVQKQRELKMMFESLGIE